jgi:hypothetical protein
MLPSDIDTYARARYNATGDTFFSDLEIYYSIYQAELELAAEVPGIIEAYLSAVALTQGTRKYSFPAQARAIKRIEYVNLSGTANKLEPITFREDDALTLVNVASTTQGTPQFYETYNYNIYLRPIPDTTGTTLNVYSYNEPIVPSASSVLEIPTIFHMDLVDYVVFQMYLKDKNLEAAKAYADLWTAAKMKIKRWVQKKKRTDAFTIVMNEDNLAVTLTGPV